jgi:hypothetical protein
VIGASVLNQVRFVIFGIGGLSPLAGQALSWDDGPYLRKDMGMIFQAPAERSCYCELIDQADERICGALAEANGDSFLQPLL